jgi:hypothetical protein
VGGDGAARGATLTRAHTCVMVQQALHEELVRSCGSQGTHWTLPFVAPNIATHWRQNRYCASSQGCHKAQACHCVLLRDRLCICCRADLTDNVVAFSVGESMPTLKHGQAIRGHYRAGNELVIHARPCLALLPAYMASLAHVQHLRILGALWARPVRTVQVQDHVRALTQRPIASLHHWCSPGL